MKKIVSVALSLAFLAGLSQFAQAADDAAKKKKDGESRRAELLKKYDKNKDGKLDESERAAAREDRKKEKKGTKDELKKKQPESK